MSEPGEVIPDNLPRLGVNRGYVNARGNSIFPRNRFPRFPTARCSGWRGTGRLPRVDQNAGMFLSSFDMNKIFPKKGSFQTTKIPKNSLRYLYKMLIFFYVSFFHMLHMLLGKEWVVPLRPRTFFLQMERSG
jgi:hypothetical protein